MKAISSYIAGLKISGKSLKMVLFIYLINLVLGLIIVIPFHKTLQSAFGFNMLPDSLLKGFDFTAVAEFMKLSSKNISGFIAQMRWVVFLFVILNVLFAGGILHIFKLDEKYKISNFISGSFSYFFRFFKLFLYMLLFNFVVTLIVWVPFVLIIKSASDTVASESTLVYLGLMGGIIHIFLLMILLMVSFYTKIRIVNEDTKQVFRSIFRSFGFVFKHFFSTFILLIMLLLNLIILLLVFWFFNKVIGTSTGITILIMFIIQQLFIFTRVFFRVMGYSSQYSLYNILK